MCLIDQKYVNFALFVMVRLKGINVSNQVSGVSVLLGGELQLVLHLRGCDAALREAAAILAVLHLEPLKLVLLHSHAVHESVALRDRLFEVGGEFRAARVISRVRRVHASELGAHALKPLLHGCGVARHAAAFAFGLRGRAACVGEADLSGACRLGEGGGTLSARGQSLARMLDARLQIGKRALRRRSAASRSSSAMLK